ncbi:Modifier of rudimentary Modr [Penicillium canariense]|uniref:Modifier of rudimentary Modr n=1 Tax=Penicillium canariense TaxID=189055 RepID=A0A9W9LJ63_9EURO|nr:Modifier of rudimentary Modr [Penicillium canariense]KAJ5160472.1 Modifier of rudimentary Modr [Penicillium canariense]
MSQPASPYPTQSSFYSTPPIMNPSINPDTPPPPPPKPSSHEASRGGTPQNRSSMSTPLQAQPGHRPDPPASSIQAQYQITSPSAPLPAPPSIEEGWLPDIVKDKSTIDLQSILKDPTLLSALSARHPSHTTRQQNLESLIQVNKDLATRLIDLQNHVSDLHAQTETMLMTHQSLEVSWRKKQTEMDAALAPWSPKALYQRLSAAIVEQEAVCQAVEESFLDGNHQGRATEKEITDWVRRVRAEAAKLAARKEAKARWDEGRVGGWR